MASLMYVPVCRSTAFVVAFLSLGTGFGQCGPWENFEGLWLYEGTNDRRGLIVTDTSWTVVRSTSTGRSSVAYSVSASEQQRDHPLLPLCLVELIAGTDTLSCIIDHVSTEGLYFSCSGIGGGYRRSSPFEFVEHFGYRNEVVVDPAPAHRERPVVDTTGKAAFERNKGWYELPLANAVVEKPSGKQVSRMHPATLSRVVIRSDTSEHVRVIAKGEVSAVFSMPCGADQVVIVGHGCYRSVYIDLASVVVDKGAVLDRGQVIGSPTCGSDGCRIAFELWTVCDEDRVPEKLDPHDWFKE